METFHMSDEEAIVIVDDFIGNYPEILKWYDREFLYKV